jgi:hypothetical protein
MKEEKIPLNKKDPEFLDQLYAIGMSDRSITDMTFSIGDHQFLTRLMTSRDETLKADVKKIFEEESKSLASALANVVADQNKRMFGILDEQTRMIKDLGIRMKSMEEHMSVMKEDVSLLKEWKSTMEEIHNEESKRLSDVEHWATVPMDVDRRINTLERYASIKWTLIRWGVAIIIAVLLALVIHAYFPNMIPRLFRLACNVI